MEIDEPGEHKIVLTITSGKKSWQKSLKFTALKPEDGKQVPTKKTNKENKWRVVTVNKDPTDPPIERNGNVYELNANNPESSTVLNMLGVLLGE